MDACAHLCIALLQARGAMPAGTAYLPWATGSYAVHRTDVEPVRGVARLREISGDDATFDVAMLAADGSTVARLDGWRLRRVSARPEPLRVPAWTPAAVASMRSGAGGRWLLLRAAASRAPDGQNTSDCLSTSIARELERAGRAVELVDVGEPGSWTPASPADWSTAGGYEGIVLLTARDNPTFPPLGAARSTDDRACRALLDLAGIFAEDRLDAPRLLVVTRGAQSVGEASGEGDPTGGSAVGLARAVRAERPWLRCTALDLDPAPGIRALPETEAEKVVAEALAETAAAEVALRGDARLVRGEGAGSFIAITGRQAGPIVLRHELPGTLDGIAPVRAPESVEPPAGHVVVRVEAAGVNFKDVLTALGEVPGEEVRGHEAAGEVVAVGAGLDMPRVGDRVLVYWPGCFASHVVVPVERVFPAPRGLAPAACATIPVAFGTAWYALHDLAHINANSRVLIHAGAGGVGLAAVQLAIEAGARVFATAGTPGKRAMLERLGAAAVFDSRSAAFSVEVLAATDGSGVDVVVNSLTGDRIAAGLRCLRPGGTFIELGTRERLTPSEVRAIRDDVRYTAFQLNDVADADPDLLPRIFRELNQRFEDGRLQPLPASIFDLADAGAAFRRVARAEHIGKTVLIPPQLRRPSVERGWCVVTGGTGALGTATVRWLASRGARRIALLARRSPDANVATLIEALRALGADVRAMAADVAEASALEHVLASLRDEAPITAVFHAAGVVDAATIGSLDRDRLQTVLRPKVDGAWNLHRATRDDPIEAFVLYSAIGPLLDGAGLGAYAAANASLDALAGWRRAQGLPAVSVVWGAWSEAGMAAELDDAHRRRWTRRGLESWSPDAGAAMLDAVLDGAPPVVVAARLRQDVGDAAATHHRRLAGSSRSKAGEPTAPASGAGGPEAPLVARLAATAPHARAAVIHEHVHLTVTAILGHDEPVDPTRPLRDLGLDSLSAIELRNALSVALGRPLPAALAFDHPTVDALAAHLLQLAGMDSPAAPGAPESGASGEMGMTAASARVPADADAARHDGIDSESIAALSDEEAERLLARELEDLHATEGALP